MSAPVVFASAGLVSPAGLTLRDHAFFLRARAPAPAPSPFLGADDERLRARYCPWLGARAPLVERLVALATAAVDDALAPLHRAAAIEHPHLIVCMASPWAGLEAADCAAVERALASALPGAALERMPGAAGAFAALERAQQILARDESAVVVIVVVDSLISIEAIGHLVTHPPSFWAKLPLAPSEAAAALVLMKATRCRRLALRPIGELHGAATAVGAANDDNDDGVDGGAMTAALGRLPSSAGRVRTTFGQIGTDDLRRQEWTFATTRSSERFELDHELHCIEDTLGLLGAAAGGVSVAHGLATLLHDAARGPETQGAPFFAWAISRDGTRGVAACSVLAR